MSIIRLKSTDGTSFEFDDEAQAGSGGMKDVFFSKDRKLVVGWYRKKPDSNAMEHIRNITGIYRQRIFEQEGGAYWESLFCWPSHIIEEQGMVGVVMPAYQSHFFFEHGSKNGDFLDIKGREKILGVHARKVPLGPDVDLRIIARGCPGFSGADLANLVNEAALTAARMGRRFVTMDDFEQAKDKVMMGAERRSMVLTDDQKAMTAYHEAGHAIVGMALPKCDPVYKATIIPRGGALGMVMSLPEMDRLNWHKDQCKQNIAMTMAGKAAEIIKWGEDSVSNGPSGDIMQASSMARAMVLRWGMSDAVGNIDYSEAHQGYTGNTGGFSVSAETKTLIENEVKKLIDEGYDTARTILLAKHTEFERLAQGLLEYETLTGDQIKKVTAGEKIGGDDDKSAPTGGTSVLSLPKTRGKAVKPGLEPQV